LNWPGLPAKGIPKSLARGLGRLDKDLDAIAPSHSGRFRSFQAGVS
jgi:hypothetical protein